MKSQAKYSDESRELDETKGLWSLEVSEESVSYMCVEIKGIISEIQVHHQKLWMTFVKTYAIYLHSVEDFYL
ncbi:hypothetical protein AN161_23480 [Lysinibacillus sp. FJAT-14222]|nr:hypothetical protein AN161_23480 [Lysinibacillus sp. FJAT-14222]